MKSTTGADAPYFFAPNPRHLSEQYFTSSHTLAQALRQTNGRPQQAQSFTGKSDFLRIFAITNPNSSDRLHPAAAQQAHPEQIAHPPCSRVSSQSPPPPR